MKNRLYNRSSNKREAKIFLEEKENCVEEKRLRKRNGSRKKKNEPKEEKDSKKALKTIQVFYIKSDGGFVCFDDMTCGYYISKDIREAMKFTTKISASSYCISNNINNFEITE